MITATLYNYVGHRNTVNKNLDDCVSAEFNGEILDESNVLYPVLTIRLPDVDIIDFNYCFIPELRRFYFVDSITHLSLGKATLKLSVDVLKSYEFNILQASATVTRTDNPDKHSSNRETIYNRKPNFEKIKFPNKKLFNETGTMIMVTIKG